MRTRSTRKIPSSSAALSTTNPKYTLLLSNPALCSDKHATNCLSHRKADISMFLLFLLLCFCSYFLSSVLYLLFGNALLYNSKFFGAALLVQNIATVMKRNFGINFWKKKRYARTRKTY